MHREGYGIMQLRWQATKASPGGSGRGKLVSELHETQTFPVQPSWFPRRGTARPD